MATTGAEVIRYVFDVTGDEALTEAAKSLLDVGDVSDETAASIRALADEFAKVQQAKAAAASYDSVRIEQDRLAESTDALGLRLKLAAENESELARVLREKNKATDDAVAAQDAYRTSEERTTAGTRAHADAVRQAKVEQRAATTAYEEAEATLADSTRQFANNTDAQAKNKQQLSQLASQLAATGQGTGNLADAQQRLSQRSDELTGSLGKIVTEQQRAAATERALTAEAARGAAERDQYNATLERTRAATANAKKETAGLSAEANTATGVFSKLKGMLAGLLGVFSFASLVQGIRSIIGAGNDAEQSFAQLQAALDSTGNSAGLTADELVAMAEKVRASSNLSNEQIISAQTRLLSYTNILRDEFPAALQVTIDQAQRLGISVEQSAEIVGKALQSPSDAMSSLAKQGFKLEEGQKTLLKQLEATGRTAEAQRIIIDLLAESYGGAAAASRIGTMAGLWKGLTDRVGDFIGKISGSGVFEYLKAQLIAVDAALQRMTADGSLEAWAKRISDALIGTAEAVKGGIKFVADYAGTLTLLAKAYALVKVESFLSGLAAIATGAKQGTGLLQLLTQAILAIPAIRVVVLGAAAITLASDQLDLLAKKIYESSSAGEYWKARLAELQTETRANAERFGDAAKALEGFSQVQLKTAEQVAALSEAERDAYKASGKGLTEYLQLQIAYYDRLKAANGLTAEGIEYLQGLRVKLDAAYKSADAFSAGIELASQALATGLTPSAQKLVNELTNIVSSSALVKERLKTMFEGLDTKSFEQLGDMALALQHIGEASDVAGKRLRDGLVAELKNLSGEELLRFQQSAVIAFEQTSRVGEQTALVLGATLQAALDKLGVSAAASGATITATGRDIIASFTAVTENARASGAQIEAAFRQAVASASTKAELEQLGAGLEAAAQRGTISAGQTERAMVSLRARVRELAEEANPLADAFARLGIESQQSLDAARDSAVEAFKAIVAGAKEGLATQEDVKRAWVAQAQAQLDAAKDVEPWKLATLESQIAVQASIYGTTDALDQLGLKGAEAGAKISEGMVNAKAATDGAAESARLAALGYGDLLYEANKGNAAAQAMLQSIKDGTDTTSRAATGQQAFAAGIVATGDAAGVATSQITTLNQASETYAADQMRRAAEISQSGGYGSQYLLDVKARLTQQELALVEATQQLNDRYGSQAELADLARRATISGTVVLDQQIAQLERQKEDYADLSEQIRGPYIAAIDQAIAKVREQAAATQAASSSAAASANLSADAREREAQAAQRTADAVARAAATSPGNTTSTAVNRTESTITVRFDLGGGAGAAPGAPVTVDFSTATNAQITALVQRIMPEFQRQLEQALRNSGARP